MTRMNVNTRMLSSVIMISLLALMGTLYVSVPIANADDLVEEVPIANADDIVEEPPRAVTQPVFEVVFLDQYGDEYGYVIGEDGTIIEEFDGDY